VELREGDLKFEILEDNKFSYMQIPDEFLVLLPDKDTAKMMRKVADFIQVMLLFPNLA